MSDRLKELADQLCAKIADIEKGLEAQTPVRAVYQHADPKITLVYRRFGKEWGIGVGDDTGAGAQQLADCPLATKADAVAAIPGLLAAIETAREAMVARLTVALAALPA